MSSATIKDLPRCRKETKSKQMKFGLNTGEFLVDLLSMLFILSYYYPSILFFTHDYPSCCLGEVPCVLRNVRFAGTPFHKQSIFILLFS